jgi:hypothetical protein
MRADLSQAALANDLVLQAASDQGQLSNLCNVSNTVSPYVCPTYAPCPPNNPGGGSGVGTSGSGSGSGGGSGSAGGSGGGGSCGVATPRETRNDWPEIGVSLLLGLSVWRSRRRRSPVDRGA